MVSAAMSSSFSASTAGPPYEINPDTQILASVQLRQIPHFYSHDLLLKADPGTYQILLSITHTLEDHLCSLQVLLTLTSQEHGFLLNGLSTACEEKKTALNNINNILKIGFGEKIVFCVF